MTAKFHPRCGFLGCDPKQGECLGFCDFNKPPELAIDVAEPDDDNGMQMLAVALICTIFAVLLGLSLFAVMT